MTRTYLFSKIHRATITQCDLNYEGSITIDVDLLSESGIREFEKVDILNINNGERFSTYVIPGERGSGIIGINGAGARLTQVGDKVIILSYIALDDKEIRNSVYNLNIKVPTPKLVFVDENNKIVGKEG